MTRPSDLYDREREWGDLISFADGDAPIRLGIVYGRRRHGKSWLLRRAVAQVGGLYTMALQHDRRSALDRFASELAQASGVSSAAFRLDDWEQALRAAREVLTAQGPAMLVLDEYPYLLEHSPELSSSLQALVDDCANEPASAPFRIVVCGSAIAVMEQLLSGQAPLRGRTQLELRLQAFDFRSSAAFWGVSDPEVAFHLDAVLGGTPGYRSMTTTPPPDALDDLPDWLAATVLNPASALFTEAEYLLREDPKIQSRAVYFAILSAIAHGHRTPTAIGGAIGRDRTALAHPLDVLTKAGFVTHSTDVLRARGSSYRIADPIVRFHHLITRPRLAQFEERRWEEAWRDAVPTFRAGVLGPHIEELAREWVRRFADPATCGGDVGEVGHTVVSDRHGRARHEVDVVALAAGARRGKKTAPIRCLGEAKDSDRARTVRDLERLERVRALLLAEGADCVDARLLLFSRAGFDPELERLAEARTDVELVDLERLYRGS